MRSVRPMLEMKHTAECTRCRREVQIVLINPTPATRFAGPEAKHNRYRFAPHFVSTHDQRLCDHSDAELPVA